uniref:Uncharacterized protein n=1 Tax=Anguilla anguilla TaxID=7936 RepID=A0A0E9ULP2_ANGAN
MSEFIPFKSSIHIASGSYVYLGNSWIVHLARFHCARACVCARVCVSVNSPTYLKYPCLPFIRKSIQHCPYVAIYIQPFPTSEDTPPAATSAPKDNNLW